MEVTELTVAVKPALVACAGIVTDAGTVTAVLLLFSETLRPLLGAALVSVTVQASDPGPVMLELVQVIALNAAVGAGAATCSPKVFETLPAVAVNVTD